MQLIPYRKMLHGGRMFFISFINDNSNRLFACYV